MTEFKVNDYLKIKLEEENVNIYVNDAKFLLCKHLKLMKLEQKDSVIISPKTEFWGHCSILQTWAENNYSLDILDKHFATSLLKKLRKAGDSKAKEALSLLTNCVYCNQVLSKTDVYCPNCGKFILNPDNPRRIGSFDINKIEVDIFNESCHLEAIEKYKIKLRKDPQNIKVLYLLGKSYDILKKYRKLIACLKRSLFIDPSNKEKYNKDIVDGYIKLKRYKNALLLCGNVLQKEPENIEYLILKGRIYINLEEYDKALTLFNECLSLDKESNINVYGWLGVFYFHKNEFYDALKIIRKGLHIWDSNILHLLKWQVQYMLGESNKLIPILKNKLNEHAKKDIFYISISSLLGDCYLKIGKYYKAIKYYKKGRNPLLKLSEIYESRRNFTKAINLCKKSIDKDKMDENLWVRLGFLYAERQNFEKAEKAINIALALNPHSNYAKASSAYIKIKMKQPDEAINICDEILKQVPNHLQGLLYKGIGNYEKGNLDEASDYIKQVLKVSPNWDRARLYLAKIYYHQNQHDTALEIIKNRSNPYSYKFFELVYEIINN